jgi:glycosyltransferase involved in cell wall biosynthesis
VGNLIDGLGHHFDFRVVTRDRDFLSTAPYPIVQEREWVNVGNAEVCYLPPEHLGLATIARVLRTTRHDLLYINSCFSPVFSVLPLILRRFGRIPRTPVILAPRGELARGALKYKAVRKKAFLSAARAVGLYRGVVWHAAHATERAEIISNFGANAQIAVAGDVATFDASVLADSSPRVLADLRGPLRLLAVCRIAPVKNLLFAIAMLKGVKAQLEFDIYGPIDDPGYWQSCLREIRALPPNVVVRHRGSLNHSEVTKVAAGYDLFFLPTRCESFGHAILEAMAAGCPVLVSDKTPWRGLEKAGAGWDIPLEEPARFRSVLADCAAMTCNQRERLRCAAREFARTSCNANDALAAHSRLIRDTLFGKSVRQSSSNVA